VNNQTLTYDIAIRDVGQSEGNLRYEGSLASEDGQTIYLYEGQLKEVDFKLEVGKVYEVQLRPFVNNRWLELKIVAIQPKAED
jgi:hypothetical protein